MTASWTRDTDNPVTRWLFLAGHRLAVAALLSAAFAALTALVIEWGLVYVGGGSNFSTVLSSGLLSGLLTLLTVVLSINQLILSRLFGSAGNLSDQLKGTLDYRRTVEGIADVAASPNDPGAFLGLLAEALDGRVEDFRREVERAAVDVGDVDGYAAAVSGFADYLSSADDLDDPLKTLVVTLGTEYADHLDTTRRLRNRDGEALPDEAAAALDDVMGLLKAVATMRQFFKTLVLQQELALLSRRLIYTGVPAVLVTYLLSATYSTTPGVPTAIDPALMPLVVTVATAIILSPLAVLVSSLLRVATVSLYTVSIGTFVPPEETFEDD